MGRSTSNKSVLKLSYFTGTLKAYSRLNSREYLVSVEGENDTKSFVVNHLSELQLKGLKDEKVEVTTMPGKDLCIGFSVVERD